MVNELVTPRCAGRGGSSAQEATGQYYDRYLKVTRTFNHILYYLAFVHFFLPQLDSIASWNDIFLHSS